MTCVLNECLNMQNFQKVNVKGVMVMLDETLSELSHLTLIQG